MKLRRLEPADHDLGFMIGERGVNRQLAGHIHGMAVVEQTVPAPRDQVFAVLADGWSYSDWVVGTAHIRAVDVDWPAAGTRIHHNAGPWPLSVRDSTVSVASEPPAMLLLRPRMWPLGEAEVRITLIETSPGRTRVRLAEEFRAGPLRWLRTKVNDLLLHRRNRESLRRLADLAVHPRPDRRDDTTRMGDVAMRARARMVDHGVGVRDDAHPDAPSSPPRRAAHR